MVFFTALQIKTLWIMLLEWLAHERVQEHVQDRAPYPPMAHWVAVVNNSQRSEVADPLYADILKGKFVWNTGSASKADVEV